MKKLSIVLVVAVIVSVGFNVSMFNANDGGFSPPLVDSLGVYEDVKSFQRYESFYVSVKTAPFLVDESGDTLLFLLRKEGEDFEFIGGKVNNGLSLAKDGFKKVKNEIGEDAYECLDVNKATYKHPLIVREKWQGETRCIQHVYFVEISCHQDGWLERVHLDPKFNESGFVKLSDVRAEQNCRDRYKKLVCYTF